MICLIDQPAGIGDILYCQKIAAYYDATGHEVIWPIKKELWYLKTYLKSRAKFIPVSRRGDIVANRILDLEGAGAGGTPEEIMENKYRKAEVNSVGWADHINIDWPKNALKPPHKEYNLICTMFATPPQIYHISVKPPDNGLPTVSIGMADSPFDWWRVIEGATELHLVDTVFTYFVELLDVKAKRMCLYPRKPFHDHIITKANWTKPWEYMGE